MPVANVAGGVWSTFAAALVCTSSALPATSTDK
jgi:hypothetical protein